jgi:hypothetical protein
MSSISTLAAAGEAASKGTTGSDASLWVGLLVLDAGAGMVAAVGVEAGGGWGAPAGWLVEGMRSFER